MQGHRLGCRYCNEARAERVLYRGTFGTHLPGGWAANALDVGVSHWPDKTLHALKLLSCLALQHNINSQPWHAFAREREDDYALDVAMTRISAHHCTPDTTVLVLYKTGTQQLASELCSHPDSEHEPPLTKQSPA